MSEKIKKNKAKLSFNQFKIEVLNDYRIAVLSREMSRSYRKSKIWYIWRR